MRSTDLAKRSALAQHMLQQWIVIKHINNPRMFPQTLLQIRDHPPQPRLWKWIKKIHHRWFVRKRELSSIAAGRFQREALLRFASILADVLLSSPMQRRQKLHSHNAAKGIVRSHQQRSSFPRSQIDEDEVMKVGTALLTQRPNHFVEQGSFRRLIRRVEDSQQAVAPAYCRARRVDAMLPIIVSVAVALASPLRSGVARELPQRSQQLPRSGEVAFTPGNVIPPLPRRARQADSGRSGINAGHSPPS